MNEQTSLTYPEQAWLIGIVPSALAVAAVLIVLLLLREPLTLWMTLLQRRRVGALSGNLRPDPALIWLPEPLSPLQLLLACATTAILVAAAVALLASIWLALVLAAPLSAGLVYLLIGLGRHRYVKTLEDELTEAVGRLSALLKAGVGFRTALERLLPELPSGPLRDEWAFLIERLGVPLSDGGIATPQQVVSALAQQSPSRRHAALLDHLAVAVGQPQDVLAARVAAAYTALQSSNRRHEEARTELSQMRYSGMAVGLAGMIMAIYLLWVQWDRAVAAYSSPLGMLVALLVLAALLLPIVGGMLLAQAEDVDY